MTGDCHDELLTSGVHIPPSTKSLSRYLFTMVNSPAKTRRLYMLEVKGSVDSLLPVYLEKESNGMAEVRLGYV